MEKETTEKRELGSYTSRELMTLNEYFLKHNLNTIKTFCEKACFSAEYLKQYLEEVLRTTFGEKDDPWATKSAYVSIPSEQFKINLTKTSREHHEKVYNLLFKIPMDELPLEFSDDELYNDLLKWRFGLGF